MERRSNWHHDEDSVCGKKTPKAPYANVSRYERCLNVNPCKYSSRNVNANYRRSNAKFSQENANSNDGFRPIVWDGQDFMLRRQSLLASRRSSASPMIIMKSYDNLYEQLCLMKNLRRAYRKARKGKDAKWYVLEFDKNLEKNLLQLQKELLNMTYEPKPLKQFAIRDPKTRVISASNFRDRVVHHALCNIIEPIFDKMFISDCYANRKDKGAHAALKRFDYFKRKVSQNGRLLPNAKDNNQVYGYVLKADIRHYFDSVDHKIMMQIISRKIKDKKILWLIGKILNNHNCKIAGKGMPIGNLTSQFFANVYLSQLDYFVKHRLKAKYYIRYVDDFVILDASKKRLEFCQTEISTFLRTIKLELHPEKSKILPLCNGINLLGFRVFYNYKLPKKSNIRLVQNRISYFIDLYRDAIISKEEILMRIDGWNAYAIHGNTFNLRRRMSGRLKKSLA